MGFSFEEVSERLECPHIDCDYHEVVTEVSGTYVEGKLTLERSCRNCQGRDHLMFDLGEYRKEIEEVSVGDEYEVNDRLMFCRASSGDRLRVTAVAENPMYADSPLSSNPRIIISFVRNPEEDSPYRTGTTNPDRLSSLISKGSIRPAGD